VHHIGFTILTSAICFGYKCLKMTLIADTCRWWRSQWPRCLRRRSTAALLLRLWVRIPPGAWMFICCVLSGIGLRDHSSKGVLPTVALRCVWSRKLVKRGGHSPRWAAAPEKIIIIIIIICCWWLNTNKMVYRLNLPLIYLLLHLTLSLTN
jgi:hypothetical protein